MKMAEPNQSMVPATIRLFTFSGPMTPCQLRNEGIRVSISPAAAMIIKVILSLGFIGCEPIIFWIINKQCINILSPGA